MKLEITHLQVSRTAHFTIEDEDGKEYIVNFAENDVFDEFSETTKFYLTNVKMASKKIESNYEIKENEIEKEMEKDIEIDIEKEKDDKKENNEI